MAKKNLALLLSLFGILPSLFSCASGDGPDASASQTEESSLKAQGEESLRGFAQTLQEALDLGKEKTSGYSLALEKGAYYKGKATKKERALFEGGAYSDDSLSLSAKGEVYYANQDGGFDLEQGNQDFYHEYGYRHGLFLDAFYWIDGAEKSINSLRSKGIEMEEKDALSILRSGRLDFSGVDNQATILYQGGVYSGGTEFLYQTYFGEEGLFQGQEAKANASSLSQGGSIAFSTYFDEADANDDVYRRAFAFEFTFADGVLVEASGREEDRLVSAEGVSEAIASSFSFQLSNRYEAKSASGADFDRFFYTDYIPFLGENPYSVTEADSYSVGARYFVQIAEGRPNTAIRNIDSIRLQSATRNGEEAKEGDFAYAEEDNAITFLRGGEYELSFLSRAGIKRSLSISLPEDASL